jgi:threonine dehydrogenase-like Zn-dependent dehydrogenase
MRAVVRRGPSLLVTDIPDAEPGVGQVVAKTLACGICGSDLHALHGLDHGVEIAQRSGAAPTIDPSMDLVFGHEYCAEILDFGPGTSRRLRPGTRVVAPPFAFGPLGPELIGFSTRFRGAFAERVVLTEALLLPVPNGLASKSAALTEPLAVGAHAVEIAQPGPQSVALVIGCGPIGLAVIAALKRRGVGPIVATDFSPARRARAERLGADIVIDPGQSSPHGHWSSFDVPATLSELGQARMGGRMLRDAIVFECVGLPGMLQSLIENVPPTAHLIIVGACIEDDRILPIIAINKQLRFSFVFGYSNEEFADTLNALANGEVDPDAFLTGTVGLDGVADAFDRLGDRETSVKILVDPCH